VDRCQVFSVLREEQKRTRTKDDPDTGFLSSLIQRLQSPEAVKVDNTRGRVAQPHVNVDAE
jgi:hypothetical protein